MRPLRPIFATLLLLPIAALAAPNGTNTATGAAATPAADLESRRQALSRLLDEHWEYVLRTSPEFASILGDKRWNDQVSDLSQEALDRDLEETRKFLARFEAIDTTGFPDQEALNKELMVRQMRERLDNVRFHNWRMPVNQMGGIHLEAAQFPSLLSFETVKDYEDWIARLRKLPKMFDDTVAHMRAGMAEGLMPPKFLLEKVAAQAQGIADTPPETLPFSRPLADFPAAVPAAARERLTRELHAALREAVLPAYAAFAKFVREEYAPSGRAEPGVWSLPDGAARYAASVKRQTTTDMTPEQIHQLGLQQVAAIEAEMLAIAKQLGYQDLKSFNAAIEADPKLRAGSRERMLELYRRYTDQMWAKLPQLFGRLPKAKVVVEPVEEFREKEAAGAQYNQGTPDGSRPGMVKVNTGEPEKRKTLTIESTAYHEAVPGHHLQISIAQELPSLPPFRQQAHFTAYVEGWALYSERLGKEVGFYQDPYSDYGRLQDEMLRAIRLVVDTGFHFKRWSRAQVVQFFHDHSALDEPDIQAETDRYIVWPGQALGYKIGQLKIMELRERVHQALGARFDVRAFHDEVLSAGALPLEVLERRIDAWIARQAA
ncbi:MAG: DUF885 domain-containing protein [Thermoanaerobaculia bacterium]